MLTERKISSGKIFEVVKNARPRYESNIYETGLEPSGYMKIDMN